MVTLHHQVASAYPATRPGHGPQHGGRLDSSFGARSKIALRTFENSSDRAQTLQSLISSQYLSNKTGTSGIGDVTP
jgi:hypothetical protein